MPILWAPGVFAFFLQEDLHVHKISSFYGGGILFFLLGGGGGAIPGAIPPPPPRKRGISAILARYPMKTRHNACNTPPLRYYLERVLREMGGYLALGR